VLGIFDILFLCQNRVLFGASCAGFHSRFVLKKNIVD
jgi:hypothetical protein